MRRVFKFRVIARCALAALCALAAASADGQLARGVAATSASDSAPPVLPIAGAVAPHRWTSVVTVRANGRLQTWSVALHSIIAIDATSREAYVSARDGAAGAVRYYVDGVDCRNHVSLLAQATPRVPDATDQGAVLRLLRNRPGSYAQALAQRICGYALQAGP